MANEAVWEALPKREQQEKENTLRTESEWHVYLVALTDSLALFFHVQATHIVEAPLITRPMFCRPSHQASSINVINSCKDSGVHHNGSHLHMAASRDGAARRQYAQLLPTISHR